MKQINKEEMIKVLKDLITYSCCDDCLEGCQEHKYGKFFSVSFIKKDGTLRHMTCRLGVTKGLTGKGMSYDALSKNLLTVRDVEIEEFRNINLETLKEVSLAKEKYVVV